MPGAEATATITVDHSWDSNSQIWSGKKKIQQQQKETVAVVIFNYCNMAQSGFFKMKLLFGPAIIPALHFIFPRQSPWTLGSDLQRSSDPTLCHRKANSGLWSCLSCYHGLQAAKNLTCSVFWCSCSHSSKSAPAGGADCFHAAQYLSWSVPSLIWQQRGTLVTLSDCQRSG